jgi:UDP-N-acetyl-2-amino-2-deoxyglucuronate dehydrogenase
MGQHVHAIIGCGRVAPNHADGFRSLPGTEIRWACDRNEAAAAALAGDFGIPRVTTDPGDVLRDPAVVSVSVAVDHAQHAALTLAALEAGKHVLLEKPIALEPEDGASLIRLAERRGKVLSVVSQHRYDPLVADVRAWIDAGLLGPLVAASVTLRCRRTREYYTGSYWRGTWAGEGGSVLINQGYHAIDILRWTCGDLEVVGASMTTSALLAGTIETEDTLGALLRGRGSMLATVNLTAASVTNWKTRIEIVGQAGTVVFTIDHPARLHSCEGRPELLNKVALARAHLEQEPAPGLDYYGVSHRRQIADFCQSVASGSPMLSGPHDAVRTLELVAALYRMARAEALVPASL